MPDAGARSAIGVYLQALQASARHAPNADGVTASERLGPSPYRNLLFFDENSAALLTTRDKASRQIRHRFEHEQCVVVIGASGCGKSSLVRGKVLEELRTVTRPITGREGDWQAIVFRPVLDPVGQFAAAFWRDVVADAYTTADAEPDTSDPRARRSRAIREALGFGDDPGRARDQIGLDLRMSGAETADEHDGFATAWSWADRINKAATGDRRPGPANLMIIIDQFEEIFRSGVSAAAARDLCSMIRYVHRHKPKGVYLAISMRAEDVHRCAEIDGLAEIVNSSVVLIDWLDRSDLRRAIVQPAHIVLDDWGVLGGWGDVVDERDFPYETPVVDALLDEVAYLAASLEHKNDHLPLLQHGMDALWRQAARRWSKAVEAGESGPFRVTSADLDAVRRDCGSEGLWLREQLSRSARRCLKQAEAEFTAALPESLRSRIDARTALRAALCEMASRDENGRFHRDFALIAPVVCERLSRWTGGDAEVEQALGRALRAGLEVFVVAGLLVRVERDGPDAYDVAHEALVRNWDRLRRWIDTDSDLLEAHLDSVVEIVERRSVAERIAAINPKYRRMLCATHDWWRARAVAAISGFGRLWRRILPGLPDRHAGTDRKNDSNQAETLPGSAVEGVEGNPVRVRIAINPKYRQVLGATCDWELSHVFAKLPGFGRFWRAIWPGLHDDYAGTYGHDWLLKALASRRCGRQGAAADWRLDPVAIADGVRRCWRWDRVFGACAVLLVFVTAALLTAWLSTQIENDEVIRQREALHALLVGRNFETDSIPHRGVLEEMHDAFNHFDQHVGSSISGETAMVHALMSRELLVRLGRMVHVTSKSPPTVVRPPDAGMTCYDSSRNSLEGGRISVSFPVDEAPTAQHNGNRQADARSASIPIFGSKRPRVVVKPMLSDRSLLRVDREHLKPVGDLEFPGDVTQACLSLDGRLLVIAVANFAAPLIYTLEPLAESDRTALSDRPALRGVIVEKMTVPDWLPDLSAKDEELLRRRAGDAPIIEKITPAARSSDVRAVFYKYGAGDYVQYYHDGLLSPVPGAAVRAGPVEPEVPEADWSAIKTSSHDCRNGSTGSAGAEATAKVESTATVEITAATPMLGNVVLELTRFVVPMVAGAGGEQMSGCAALMRVDLIFTTKESRTPIPLASFADAGFKRVRIDTRPDQPLRLMLGDAAGSMHEVAVLFEPKVAARLLRIDIDTYSKHPNYPEDRVYTRMRRLIRIKSSPETPP